MPLRVRKWLRDLSGRSRRKIDRAGRALSGWVRAPSSTRGAWVRHMESRGSRCHIREDRAGATVVDDVDLPGQVVIDLDRDARIRGFELFDGSRSLAVKLLDEFRE